MGLKFCSFASGSSGNCYYIGGERANLILDPGIPGREIFEGLDELGIMPDEVDGIFLTHEHSDHIKSIRMVAGKTGAPVYGSFGTLEAVKDRILTERRVLPPGGGMVEIGDVRVETFSLSHDSVEPMGFSFTDGKKRITVITDTGLITEEQKEFLKDSDIMAIEANHEKNILIAGPYHYDLKRRILGEKGHTSNEDAALALIEVLKARKKEGAPLVALAHLSRENNTPDMAYVTIKNMLFGEGLYENKHFRLTVLGRDERSPLFKI